MELIVYVLGVPPKAGGICGDGRWEGDDLASFVQARSPILIPSSSPDSLARDESSRMVQMPVI